MKKLIRKSVWPMYIGLVIFLTGAGAVALRNASAILRDHTVVSAPIELVDSSSRTKKGHTTTTYEFEYRYSVDGKEFVQEYSAVNEKGEKYVDAGFIEIAYANGEPGRSGALHTLKRQASFGGLIKRSLIGWAILGIVAFFVWAWAGAGNEAEEDLSEPKVVRKSAA